MVATEWGKKAVAQVAAMYDIFACADYYRAYPATIAEMPIEHVILSEWTDEKGTASRLLITLADNRGMVSLNVAGTGHGPACRWIACATCEANWVGGTLPYRTIRN